ncbi:MAG TPA: PDZ domain-containing protein [Gemmatimonadaceae bacterium]
MRHTHLLALAALAGITSAAHSQEARTEATRVRASTPEVFSFRSAEPGHRPAIGVSTSTSGTLRDTLGILITAVTKDGPAEKAGLEEGNRIAAINSVNLRANAADVEDEEMSGALTRRLTRELARHKPGEEVELKVYRDGRMQTVKVRTADSDSLFHRVDFRRTSEELKQERENRPALGFSVGSTGSRRDTLGVLVMSVADSSPAARAGIEEGNRIAAINGVNLRVSHDDAGDRYLSSVKAQRLHREISQLKPGDNVTLSVYSGGRVRDVSAKVARAVDIHGAGGMMYFGGDAFAMPPMPPRPAMPAMPPMPMIRANQRMHPIFDYEFDPELHGQLEDMRMHLDMIRPQIERSLRDIRPQIEQIRRQIPARMLWVDASSEDQYSVSGTR